MENALTIKSNQENIDDIQEGISIALKKWVKKNNLSLTYFKGPSKDAKDALYLASQSGITLSNYLVTRLIKYTKENVQLESGSIGRSDCVKIAGQTVLDLEHEFEKHGYALGTMHTHTKNGQPIPFFSKFGYDHHVVNFIEAENGGIIAFDLTAKYTMDLEHGEYAIFATIAKSESELKRLLKDLTQTNWEID